MKVMRFFLSLLFLACTHASAQNFYTYDYEGTLTDVSYTATVLTRVKRTRDLSAEYPEQMKMTLRGKFTANGRQRSFKATFCAEKNELIGQPRCGNGGLHFTLGKIKEVTQDHTTATLSGSVCVSVPPGQTAKLPHPDVYFKVRQDSPRQDLIPLTYIKPQSAEKRTSHDEDTYSIPGCTNSLNLHP